MAKITIRETQNVRQAQFDASSNVVLVPLFVNTDMEPCIYETLSEFKSTYKTTNVIEYWIDGSNKRYDDSFAYICGLLSLGFHVLVLPIMQSTTFTDKDALIAQLNTTYASANFFKQFEDKNLWNIQLITSGAYNNVKTDKTKAAAEAMITLASTRGDCVALVELPKGLTTNAGDTTTSPGSLLEFISGLTFSGDLKYAACTYPWGTYSVDSLNDGSTRLPGSFGYLAALGNTLRSNPIWIAAAGVNNGFIPAWNNTDSTIGDALMHTLVGDTAEATINIYINCIMDLGSFGVRLFSNRTMYKQDGDATSFLRFLNVRHLVCAINKQIYYACMRCSFDANDLVTIAKFKAYVNPFLDKMVAGRGLQRYSWTREAAEKLGQIKLKLTIRPIEAVEDFDIEVNLTVDETSGNESV